MNSDEKTRIIKTMLHLLKIRNRISQFQSRCFFVLQTILLSFMLITCCFHSLSLIIGIKYFVFQLFGIFLPGVALYIFWGLENKYIVSLIGISYAFGVISLLIQYFILISTGLQKYSWLFSLLVAAFSLVYVKKNVEYVKKCDDRRGWIVVLVFISFILLLELFTVSFVNVLPGEADSNSIYADWLFWVGNNISFTRGFPPQDYRLCGNVFKYHYFSSIIMAQSYFVTGIDMLVLSFYYSFIVPAVMLVTAAYTLFSVVLKRREYIFLALLILLFTEGKSVTYLWHIYFCPFGYDYGYIFGMLSIYMLLKIVKKQEKTIKEIIFSAILISMTTGCKGPVGVVILIGFAMAVLYDILQNKKIKRGFVQGGIWLGAFLLTYFAFIHNDATITSEAGLRFVGIRGAFIENPRIQEVFCGLMDNYNFSGSRLTKIIAILLYVYNTNKATIFLFIVGIIYLGYRIIFWGNGDMILIILSAICVWGIALTITTRQSGSSEMYFIMSIIPYGIISGFYVIEKIEGVKYLFKNAIFSVLIIVTYLGMICFWDIVFPKAREGVLCMNSQPISNRRFQVLGVDYEAYQWINDNTEEQDIIAIDYSSDKVGNHHLTAGVFTQRYIWNDGYYSSNKMELERRNAIVENLLNGKGGAAIELKENGVSFFMQNLRVNTDFYLDSEEGSCMYENESYRIYELKAGK